MKVFGFSQGYLIYLFCFFLVMPVQVAQGYDELRSEDLLIRYSENNNVAGAAEQGITIHIYRSGKVTISMPVYMKRAGQYQVFLELEKLEALWQLLVNETILNFDAPSVREILIREQYLIKDTHAVVSNVSDKANVMLEFYPNRYQPMGIGIKDENFVKRIQWTGLRWDAEFYPHIESIQLLSQLQKFFLHILERDDLLSIDE